MNEQCQARVHPIRDAREWLGEHEGCVRDARGTAESIYGYLIASQLFACIPN